MTVHRDVPISEGEREGGRGQEREEEVGERVAAANTNYPCPAVISHAGDTNSLVRSDVAPHCGSN